MSEIVLRAVDVSKRFTIHKDKSLKERLVNRARSREHVEDFWALRDVNLEVESGSTLALIGHNGSGKSTLLKTIGGILTPNTGYVERRGRLAALLELGAGFHPDLTGRENVYLNASILGLSRAQTESYFDAIVDFSGIEQFIDTQVKFYSSGMYVRLAFAVAVHVDPDILLVDEVLSVGDEPFQRKCIDRIKQFQREGRTIVVVTHGLDAVRQLCDRAVLLEHGRMKVDGTPVEALRAFREAYADDPIAGVTAGDKQLEIVDARFVGVDGQIRRRLRPAEPVAVEIDVLAHAPTDDWAVGIALTNSTDLTVLGTNTVMLGHRLEPLSGTTTVCFDFAELPVVEDQYHLTVALHPSQGPEYHRREKVATVRVDADPAIVGVAYALPIVAVAATRYGQLSGQTPQRG